MTVIERTNVLTGAQLRPFENAGVPGAGLFNDEAPKGALCKDTTNGVLYINTGTLASTVWTVVGTQV